jgi:hypothetical protein
MLIGHLIKNAIDLSQRFLQPNASPLEAQREQLTFLLDKAKDTSFGLYYGFRQMLESDDPVAAYQEQVPIFEYDKMAEDWWGQQLQFPDITWPGQPKYYAKSSGTTGSEPKRIPVTEDMLTTFRKVGLSQVSGLSNYDLPADFFERDILMLSSSANLERHLHHEEGEISGINTSNLPQWFSDFYKPGLELAQIDDWDDRIAAISKVAPDWDVCAIAGIPSWIQLMLEYIIEDHKLDNIRDIWPNLQLYASGGVAFPPYRERFDELTGGGMIYQDTYLASEGFFAFTARPDTMEMRLAIEHGMFYEFIPFDERGFDETGRLLDDPEVLTIDQVEEGKDYALLVSTPAGSWRYMIGDTIQFSDLNAMEMHISGRTKYWLNVVGSQLSEEKLNAAIQQFAEANDMHIPEYGVAALKDENDEYYHQWVLGAEDPKSVDDAADQLDAILRDLNDNYAVARSKALKGLNVKIFPKQKLYDWLDTRNHKGGQVKFPKVMTDEMMEECLATIG